MRYLLIMITMIISKLLNLIGFKKKDEILIINQFNTHLNILNELKYNYKIININAYNHIYIIILSKIYKTIILENTYYFIGSLKNENNNIIQIWHSNGAIKKFGADSIKFKKWDKKTQLSYIKSFQNIDYITVNNSHMSDVFQKSFKIKSDKIINCGYPPIIDSEFEKCNTEQKVISYMPTFRDNEIDNNKQIEFAKNLIDNFEDKYEIIIKLHPKIKCDDFFCDYSNDEIFKRTNTLITDYSGVIFEASKFVDDIIFYVYDFNKYKRLQGFNLDVRMLGFNWFNDEESLFNDIITLRDNKLNVEMFFNQYNEYETTISNFINDKTNVNYKNSGNGRRKKKKKSKKVFIIISFLIILFLILKNLIIPIIDGMRPLSILIVGSDTAEHRGESKVEKTDSLMLMTFNPQTYKIDVTSIPRDTSVDYICDNTPKHQDQINEVYFVSNKDINCLTKTVSNFLNVPIDYYVKVNMDSIVEIIDLIGGLEIKAHAQDGYIAQENVDRTVIYEWTDSQTYTMNGDEALTYARFRKDSEKDYGRGKRQQQVISAMVKNIISGKKDLPLIKKILTIVDTNMKPVLLFKYYDYIFTIRNQLSNMNQDDGVIKLKDLPKKTWIGLFEYTGFDQTKVNSKTISEFNEFLNTYNGNDIFNYFIISHQFFNEAYNSHYNVVESQLQEISSSLRKNLGLNDQKVKLPEFEYGDNSALGLLSNKDKAKKKKSKPKTESTTEVCSDGTTVKIGECKSNENADIIVEDKPIDNIDDEQIIEEVKPDTDGDGIIDVEDEYPNGEDQIDTDGDGVIDVKDEYPNGEDLIDSDNDGIVDIKDEYPNGEDLIDSDNDGIPDVDDVENELEPSVPETEEKPIEDNNTNSDEDLNTSLKPL